MRKFGLVVGVGAYEDPEISDLPYAVADAVAVAGCLRDTCSFDEVVTLVSGGSPAPDHVAVLDALFRFAPVLTPDDLFFFYFAGHGVETGSGTFLLTRNARLRLPQVASLHSAVLSEALAQVACRDRVLVLDACRNDPRRGRGDGGNVMSVGFSRDILAVARAPADVVVTPATCVLFSCRAGERAYEWPDKGQGAFTHFLVEGLRGAARDEVGRLTVQGLGRFVEERVPAWARRTMKPQPQTPWSEQTGSLRDIVLDVGQQRPLASQERTQAEARPAASGEPVASVPPTAGIGSAPVGPRSMVTPEIVPLAQQLAEENGVDWRRLVGSGEDGRIVERDVLNALARVMAGEDQVEATTKPTRVAAPVAADPVRVGDVLGVMTTSGAGPGFESGSGVAVSDVGLGPERDGLREVRFDVGWEESWRGPDRPSWVEAVDNWDAVWVFVKYRVDGGDWRHAGLRAGVFDAPTGVAVDVPADGRGAFVYRAKSGYGRFDARGVRLAWDVAGDRVSGDARVELRVFAIEMVFVPEGPFYLGSGHHWLDFGRTRRVQFRAGDKGGSPFLVSDRSSIELGNAKGQLMFTPQTVRKTLPYGRLSASFPTGFRAFYVMKHLVTQGEYVGFLNTLTQPQADARKHTGSGRRYAITGSSVGSYATSLPFVALNFVSWADGAAFAAWAGLRPMTELEFEKAARGPLEPVPNEFAWGSTSITQATGLANAGTRSETPTPEGANAHYNRGIEGPGRVGSFAAPGRSRRDAGAGYYGVLELSGSLLEYVVAVWDYGVVSFKGTHGDGSLSKTGKPIVRSWPGVSGNGSVYRGGSYHSSVDDLRVSYRYDAATTFALRDRNVDGWRGARSAP